MSLANAVYIMAIILSLVSFSSWGNESGSMCSDYYQSGSISFESNRLKRSYTIQPSPREIKDLVLRTKNSFQEARHLYEKMDEIINAIKFDLAPMYETSRQARDYRFGAQWGLRKDSTNPYTISLKLKLAQNVDLKKKLEILLSQNLDFEKLSALNVGSMSVLDQASFHFLLFNLEQKLADLYRIVLNDKAHSQLPYFTDPLNEFTQWLGNLNDFSNQIISSGRSNRNYFNAILQANVKSGTEVGSALFAKLIGTGLVIHDSSRLAAESFSRNIDFEEFANTFLKLNAEAKLAEDTRKTKITNSQIVTLTVLTHDLKLEPKDTIAYLNEVASLGQNITKQFHIDNQGTTLLTFYGLKNRITPSKIVEAFASVVAQWHTKEYKGWTFDDEMLANMTVTALRSNTAPETVLVRYVEFYKENRAKLKNNLLPDYDLLLANDLSLQLKKDPSEIIYDYDRLMKMYYRRESAWQQRQTQLISILRIVYENNLSLEKLVGTIDTIFEDLGSPNLTHALTIINLGIRANLVKTSYIDHENTYLDKEQVRELRLKDLPLATFNEFDWIHYRGK